MGLMWQTLDLIRLPGTWLHDISSCLAVRHGWVIYPSQWSMSHKDMQHSQAFLSKHPLGTILHELSPAHRSGRATWKGPGTLDNNLKSHHGFPKCLLWILQVK